MPNTTATSIHAKKKASVLVTNEAIPTPDCSVYGDIPPCITWARGLGGAEELILNLEAIGFEVHRGARTTVAWAPHGWMQFIDDEGSVRFFDETGTLRAIRKCVDSNIPKMTFFTRLTYGLNVRTNRYYLYDRRSGKTLKTFKTLGRMQRWLAWHYPKYANPTAYYDRTIKPARW